MDEIGKVILSIILFISGGVCILLFGFIIPAAGAGAQNIGNLQLMFIIMGVILAGFGAVVLYLRKVSIQSSMRTKKVKKVKMKKISKPKKSTISISAPQPKTESITSTKKEQEKDIICLTCEFYDKYNPKQKCKYLSEQDRINMLDSGIKCVEYQLHHSLVDEI